MRQNFNLYLFTRGTREYAETLADILGLTSVIKDIYCRDDLIKSNDDLCKDLKSINFDLKSTVLIDDSPNFVVIHNNLIRVKKYLGVRPDDELERVEKILS